MAEFFHMGGYALYVWGSFAATALFMIAEPLIVRNQRRSMLRRIKRLLQMRSEEMQ
jgi:heme exporter protein D